MTKLQPALLKGPGTFGAVQVWRGRASASALRAAVADILGQSHPDCEVLVGLRADLFADGSPAREVHELFPMSGGGTTLISTQAAVFVQVASAERWPGVRALRRISLVMSSVADLDEEVLGGPLDGREAFGYRERGPTPAELDHLTVKDGAFHGYSVILWMRWIQDVRRFEARPAKKRDDVFGIRPDGDPISPEPAGAHVPLTRNAGQSWRMVRRGFPWRAAGVEGLAFVAASSGTESFQITLKAMLGSGGTADRLLGYARAVSGGIYVAPPKGWSG